MNDTAELRSACLTSLLSSSVSVCRVVFDESCPFLQILHILAGYREGDKVASEAVDLHRTVEAFKHCYAVRTQLGDPDFVNVTDVLVDMLSPSFAAELRSTISDKRTFGPEHYGGR